MIDNNNNCTSAIEPLQTRIVIEARRFCQNCLRPFEVIRETDRDMTLQCGCGFHTEQKGDVK